MRERPDDPERLARVAAQMRRQASRGVFDGRETEWSWRYIRSCTREDWPTMTGLIFTRDTGHHTSGWMKHPDYERCLHLSLSPAPGHVVRPSGAAELSAGMKASWLRAFFGDAARYAWCESAKTPMGRRCEVTHWRVFCDEAWNPILPRGEVYSTEFTERGWRSASQVFEEDGVVITSPVDPS